jgi:hypothetical protein
VTRSSLLVAVAALLLLAGCSGQESASESPAGTTSPPATTEVGTIPGTIETAPSPPAETAAAETAAAETGAAETAPAETGQAGSLEPQAVAALRLFVEGAGAGNAMVMWDLLSEEAQERLGPTFEMFREETAQQLEDGVGAFAGSNYGVILGVGTPTGWAVAAVAGVREVEGRDQFGAFAVALRPVGDSFRIELESPVMIAPIVPPTGVMEAENARVAAAIDAPSPVEEAALWLDGVPIESQAAGPAPERIIVAARPPEPLRVGPHVGVAYARAGDEAGAVAWTFQAT